MQHIVIHVTYTCLPGKAQELVRALKDSGAQQAVRAEPGCLQYDYSISCEAPDTVILLEKWQDQAAHEFHMRQAHMQTIAACKEGRVADMRMERYE